MGPHRAAKDQCTPATRSFIADTSTINAARVFVTTTLAADGAGPGLLQRAELVTSELAANAVAAAHGGDYTVTVSRDTSGAAVISVENATTSAALPDPSDWDARIGLAPAGRGLGIVQQLAWQVSLDQRAGEITISALLAWESA